MKNKITYRGSSVGLTIHGVYPDSDGDGVGDSDELRDGDGVLDGTGTGVELTATRLLVG